MSELVRHHVRQAVQRLCLAGRAVEGILHAEIEDVLVRTLSFVFLAIAKGFDFCQDTKEVLAREFRQFVRAPTITK